MRKSRQRDTASRLDALIEEAIVDAYGEAEQHAAFGVILEERLELPFTTQMLGLEVTVRAIEQDDAGQIVAVCVRGSARQKVSILDLPLPSPAPKGAEWIEAYRRWLQQGA